MSIARQAWVFYLELKPAIAHSLKNAYNSIVKVRAKLILLKRSEAVAVVTVVVAVVVVVVVNKPPKNFK